MKGWEIIKKIANNELKEGTKIQDNYQTYIMKYDEFTQTELVLREAVSNEIPDYSYFVDNDIEFEIIEEDKPIEELKTEIVDTERKLKGISGTKYSIRVVDNILINKINELVKEINKLKKTINKITGTDKVIEEIKKKFTN